MRPNRPLPLPEFVAMMALLFAMMAFSIDAMLPALPEIAAELTPGAENRAQLVILAFVLGIGCGTIFTGPLSDAFGRRSVLTLSMGVFMIGTLLAYRAQSLETLLLARVIQGMGAAGPRIVPMAMIRDLYEGRRMAQITSFVMTVFMIVPAIAPALGAVIISISGWRFIFIAIIGFAVIAVSWMLIRQPETLAEADRNPLNARHIWNAVIEVTSNRRVMIYTLVLTLGFTQLIGLISSIQPVYDISFGKDEQFPMWFAASSILGALAPIVNAKLVMTVGMRTLASTAYLVQAILAVIYLSLLYFDVIPEAAAFGIWFGWTASILLTVGFTLGNLNALAMQPLGHIAGLGASVVTAISTILSVILAIPIGQSFNGTPLSLLIGSLLCSGFAYLLLKLVKDVQPERAAD